MKETNNQAILTACGQHVFFNERGSDKIRHTYSDSFIRGTLSSSIAYNQDKFEKYMKENFK